MFYCIMFTCRRNQRKRKTFKNQKLWVLIRSTEFYEIIYQVIELKCTHIFSVKIMKTIFNFFSQQLEHAICKRLTNKNLHKDLLFSIMNHLMVDAHIGM